MLTAEEVYELLVNFTLLHKFPLFEATHDLINNGGSVEVFPRSLDADSCIFSFRFFIESSLTGFTFYSNYSNYTVDIDQQSIPFTSNKDTSKF
ncbi:uncharacterized protein J8A68_000135 [[Candida] subhashii]|uniref:Uncharacterized protein n=1 Tax=[Candida] subhashii TaxID=561895 RepID=A0A8J5QYV0_9ASCO|nr:uncharacterized protein J8A68_000135 [[Candida] subhashii]KAG7666330.1 hypothetical protein J8A68_000135 [[Candida] subhashii]